MEKKQLNEARSEHRFAGMEKLAGWMVWRLSWLAVFLLPRPALAGPGTNIERAGEAVTTYLIDVLGPLIFLVGLIFAIYAWLLGDERGIRRGVSVVMGGALLFAAPSIVEFVRNAVG